MDAAPRERRSDENVIMVDWRKAEGVRTGVGNYLVNIAAALEREGLTLRKVTGRGFRFHLGTALEARRTGVTYFSPESLIVPILLGSQAVITVHDLSPLLVPHRHTRRNALIHRLLLGVLLRRVNHVFVPTQQVARDIETYFPTSPAPVTVTYEGGRFEFQSPVPVLERPRRILFVGTVEPRKNVLLMCRAFIKANIPWELHIAGRTGWLSEEELTEFSDLVRHPRIIYHGFASDEEIVALYNSAQLFIYVSESEGFGLPPLEAMGAGIPVIISNDPALVEVVGDAGVTIALGPALEAELVNAITAVGADGIQREDMSQRGIERSAAFSWESAARAMIENATGFKNA